MTKNNNDVSIEEAMGILGVTEKQVKRLLREKILSTTDRPKEIKISRHSIIKHLINRNQRVPEGYISIKAAAKSTGLEESVIHGAIDREELEVKNHRGGLIIEWNSFSEWFGFLAANNRIPLKREHFLRGRILVKNVRGLHSRPCVDIFKLSQRYQTIDTKLILSLGNRKAHGECLLELVALEAFYRDWVNYEISGIFCGLLLLEMKGLFRNFDKYLKKPISKGKYNLEAFDRDIKFSRY